MQKLNIKKFAIEILLTAVLAVIILWILGSAIDAITPELGEWESIVTLLAASGLLIYAMKIRKGSESFVETLPVILIVMALIEIVGKYTTALSDVVVEFSWVGFAWVLAAAFFADVVIKKFIL